MILWATFMCDNLLLDNINPLIMDKGSIRTSRCNHSSKAIGCQWVCVFVCSLTVEPNELKFWGMISLGGADGFRLINFSRFDQPLAGKLKKTRARAVLTSQTCPIPSFQCEFYMLDSNQD